ncbi:hypothetical protein Cflav_PD0080 [Pedosphaera parvula Ellin514]|uniref:Uncharacterized protein n=1 Tax=Pedosphaera parvula (strain Ellin514) TaxID=320771 RepID=B9XSZ9_PEDPL|nr:hypothetical protein Cflav_PD0080 [Pedosphaera parvula Ellin514]
MHQDFTVVTNCEQNYPWGACLFGASHGYQNNQGFTKASPAGLFKVTQCFGIS